MEYRETITITKEECEQIDRYLTVVPTCEDDALHTVKASPLRHPQS